LSQGSGYSIWRAVLDVLREHAVFVADAVAERRQAQRGHRIQEAGRQPAQAAVAQRRVGLAVGHVFQRAGVLRQRPGRLPVGQVQRGQRVGQVRPIRNSIDR
jgi:hypothetical protein